jgi:hypothetical protein
MAKATIIGVSSVAILLAGFAQNKTTAAEAAPQQVAYASIACDQSSDDGAISASFQTQLGRVRHHLRAGNLGKHRLAQSHHVALHGGVHHGGGKAEGYAVIGAFVLSFLDAALSSDSNGSETDASASACAGSSVGIVVGYTSVPGQVWIADVMPGSPAAELGLAQGDLAVSYNGQPITSEAQLDAAVAIAATDLDGMVTVTVQREGQEWEFSLNSTN